MAAPLLQLKEIALSIGQTKLFSDLDLAIEEKSRLCIVGRNGSGKTTLMKIIAGSLEPDEGEIKMQPGLRITYMPQDPTFPEDMTALQYVESQEHATHYDAERLLDALQVSYDKRLENLSGGEARRVSLAHALVGDPDILLLDEPTNHLDVATIAWLEETIKNYRGSIIIISHDRTFLNNVTSATLWLEQGKIRRLNKSYQHFDEWAEKLLEEEAKVQLRLSKLIEQETEWSRAGITARRKRNQGRLRRLYELRERKASQLRALKMARLTADTGEESSQSIIDARNISKSYGDIKLIDDFTTRISKGDKVGIIGPNGTGKTTLLRMLIGELKPDAGKVKIGKRLDFVYLDQRRAALDPTKTLWETLCPNGGDHVNVQGKFKHVVGYLKEFMFLPEQAKSKVGILSGGEKNRLLLAMSFAKPSNLLVLDEPTNDLDMDTLDRLQDMLCEYEGTIILVSHDRSFLDNVVTSTIVLEGDGKAIEYSGGYSDYLKQRKNPNVTIKASVPEKKPIAEKRVTAPTKLSFKQQHALKVLPEMIEKLDDKIHAIEMQLSDGAIFTENLTLANQLSKDLNESKAEKDRLEHEWLELEMLKESFEIKNL